MKKIADGEIHALSEDLAYILKFIKKEITNSEDYNTFNSVRDELYIKYAEYLYNFDKEKVISIIMNYLRQFIFNSPEDFQVIFRPHSMTDLLENYASMALKFKRAQNDDLIYEEEMDENSLQVRRIKVGDSLHYEELKGNINEPV